MVGWAVDNSTDNKAISAPSWGLAVWLGLSLAIERAKGREKRNIWNKRNMGNIKKCTDLNFRGD